MSEPACVSIIQSLQTCKFCVFVYVRGLLEVCITWCCSPQKKNFSYYTPSVSTPTLAGHGVSE